MTSYCVRACAVALAIISVTATLRAQSAAARHRIDLSGGVAATYGNLSGGDFDGTKAAVGIEANAGVTIGRWQLGVGFDRTSHGHDGTDGDFVVSNAFFEPRLMFPSERAPVTPYVAGRVGRATASYQGLVGLTDKATGYIVGVGAGLLWSVAAHVQVDAAAHYARLSHDYDTGDYSDAEKGGRASLRIGLRVGLAR